MSNQIPFQARLASARQAVDAHNSAIDARGKGEKVNWDTFEDNLFGHGYTSVDALSDLTVEELQKLGLPIGVARQVFKALLPPVDATVATAAPQMPHAAPAPAHGFPGVTHSVSMSLAEHIASLPIEQIVAGYDPRDPENHYTEALLRKVRAAPCVVFSPDGTVNTTATVTLVKEIVARRPPRKSWTSPDGSILPIYRVGELPAELDLVRICPAHGCELRDDGECVDHEESWAEVSETAMQVFALGREIRDPGVTAVIKNPLELRRAIDALRSKGDSDVLKTFGVVSKPLVIVYGQRKTTNTLPRLRVPRSEIGGALEDAPGGPFGGDRGSAQPSAHSGDLILTGSMREELVAAIKSALYNESEIEQFLSFRVGLSLDEVAGPGTLPARIGSVINWAIGQGRLRELVQKAHEYRKGNPDLRDFMGRYVTQASPPPPPAPSRIHWDRDRVRALRTLLAQLYPSSSNARTVAGDVGMQLSRVDFSGAAGTFWGSVLDEAQKSGLLDEVVTRAKQDYYNQLRQAGF